MSFYPYFIMILSRCYPDIIQILPRFYTYFLETQFIQILSRFYPNFCGNYLNSAAILDFSCLILEASEMFKKLELNLHLSTLYRNFI